MKSERWRLIRQIRGLIYNVACGEALTGNAAEAVRRLDDLAARKLDLGAETDDDFSSIRKTPEWAGFLAKLGELRRPLVHSTQAFTIADPELMAAGVAVDPSTGNTFIASVRERKIVRRTKAGMVSDFVTEAQDGFMGSACVLVDFTHKLLYASTASVPFMRGYRKEDDGKSGVYVFDLKTGKVVRKAWLSDSKKHFLNQLAMNRAGDIFVSDSLTPGIYRMKYGHRPARTARGAGAFRSTQGLAFPMTKRRCTWPTSPTACGRWIWQPGRGGNWMPPQTRGWGDWTAFRVWQTALLACKLA